nr:ribbon-helix-helix domain-containing protein [Halomonas alkalisoli]
MPCIGAEPGLWEPQTRSMRLDGVSTSVHLERFFWAVRVRHIAARPTASRQAEAASRSATS